MVSVQDRIFTSPLRTQNKLPSHIIASLNTPPVSNFEKLSFLSPDRSKLPSTPASPNIAYNSPESASSGDFSKRGRPKAAMIHTLINKGHSVESSIRCRHCSRVFPREKSLSAHMRTHTGEKPYICDYPNCFKAFCQSGQLKTHQRLHSGEKPFVCSAKDCKTRFTHSNRHCPDHPSAGLLRDENHTSMPENLVDAEASKAVVEWLRRYYSCRHERTPYKHRVTSPPPSSTKRSLFGSPEMIHERENTTPPTTSHSSPSSDVKHTPLDSHRINEIINGDSKKKNKSNNNTNNSNSNTNNNNNNNNNWVDKINIDKNFWFFDNESGNLNAVKSENDLNNNNYNAHNNNNNNYTVQNNNNNQLYTTTTNNYHHITPHQATATSVNNNDYARSLSSQYNNNYTSSLNNNNIISNNILQQQNFNLINNNNNTLLQHQQPSLFLPNNFDQKFNSPTTNLNNLTLLLNNNNNDDTNNNNMIISNNNNNAIITDDSTTLREEVVVEESLKDDTFKGAMALLELANGFPTHRVIG